MDTTTIMVQAADREWTLAALHFACALARNTGAEITMIKMAPVQHLGWLGTEFGCNSIGEQDHVDLHEFKETAEDYGVAISVHVFQYATFLEAVADAAAFVDASVVFAKIPASRLGLWHRAQEWYLRHLLANQHRQLYTLEKPAQATPETWTPSIMVPR